MFQQIACLLLFLKIKITQFYFSMPFKSKCFCCCIALFFLLGIAQAQTLDLGNDTIICNFDAFEIDAGPGFSSYLWSPGNQTTQSIIIFNTETVSVTVTDTLNNVFTDSKLVVKSFPPIVNFDFNNNCVGSIVEFNDLSSTFFDPLEFWHWDFGDSNLSNDIDPIHVYNSTGIFEVKLTVTNNQGCDSMLVKTIEIFSLPEIEVGNDTTVNFNSIINLNPLVNALNPTFNWQPPAFLTDNTISNPTAQPLSDVQYIVSITDSLGCMNQDSISITVNLPPNAITRNVSLEPNSSVFIFGNQLANDPNSGDTLTIALLTQPNNGTAVLSGDTIIYFPNENFSGNDTLSFEVCDNGNPPLCEIGFIFYSTGNLRPFANNDFDTTISITEIVIDVFKNDSEFNEEQIIEILFVSQPNNGTATDLNNGNIAYLPNFGFTGVDSFYYIICDNGQPILCDTAWIFVQVNKESLFINNSFSPNNDGIMDFFVIEGIKNFPDSKLIIFNRWGEKIFQVVGYQNNFNGFTGFNEELPEATYFYTLDLNNGEKPFSGFIVLQR